MKIEKLTENKIRVILNSDEIEMKNFNLDSLMAKSLETQDLFLNILKKAEKEVNFYTEGCKLLIEAFSSLEEYFVLTITKYSASDNQQPKKKKLVAKRKSFPVSSSVALYSFQNFDTFCEFCKAIKSVHNLKLSKLVKSSSLYLWKDTYYLILKDINTKHENIYTFYSILSEFGEVSSFSDNFVYKLLEHGTSIIKKNAIGVGIKFFVN